MLLAPHMTPLVRARVMHAVVIPVLLLAALACPHASAARHMQDAELAAGMLSLPGMPGQHEHEWSTSNSSSDSSSSRHQQAGDIGDITGRLLLSHTASHASEGRMLVLLHSPAHVPQLRDMCAGRHSNASCSFQGLCARFYEKAVAGALLVHSLLDCLLHCS